MKAVLRAGGYHTIVARSGGEALARLEGVDAVITDYSMPDMDGLSLLSTMRERGGTLPVILLTAHGSEWLAYCSRTVGVFEYLNKPFDIDEMAFAVQRARAASRPASAIVGGRD